MDFCANITPVEVIKKEHLEELTSEIFILVLMIISTKTHGRNLMS